jgi:hypothetical protein
VKTKPTGDIAKADDIAEAGDIAKAREDELFSDIAKPGEAPSQAAPVDLATLVD